MNLRTALQNRNKEQWNHSAEDVFLPDIGGMLGLGFKQANTTREQEYARYRSNVQTGTCNFRYKLRTVEAVFLPDIGGMLGLGFNQANSYNS